MHAAELLASFNQRKGEVTCALMLGPVFLAHQPDELSQGRLRFGHPGAFFGIQAIVYIGLQGAVGSVSPHPVDRFLAGLRLQELPGGERPGDRLISKLSGCGIDRMSCL